MSKYVEPFSPKLRGDEFGNLAPYRNGRPHRGQDWAAKELSPIKASGSGTVFTSEWSDVLGWYVTYSAIITDKAGKAHNVFIQDAHLAKQSDLKKGDKVVAGVTVIGKVGGGKYKSGSASTGAHLHQTIGKANKSWGNPDVHLAPYKDLLNPLDFVESKGK
jgi:murein DD-endopeptidase MepM/ murein hydrolase activator NlpD